MSTAPGKEQLQLAFSKIVTQMHEQKVPLPDDFAPAYSIRVSCDREGSSLCIRPHLSLEEAKEAMRPSTSSNPGKQWSTSASHCVACGKDWYISDILNDAGGVYDAGGSDDAESR